MDEKKVEVGADRFDQPNNDTISAVSSKDLDETYDLYRKQDARDIDPQEARRVLRKIDFHILPLLMGSYMLQYLDKSSINFASVYGLQKGTHLVGQDYSWLSSIFYFGKLTLLPDSVKLLSGSGLMMGECADQATFSLNILRVTFYSAIQAVNLWDSAQLVRQIFP